MELTAVEYLAHCYKIPEQMPKLPLADESYIAQWHEINSVEDFKNKLGLTIENLDWQDSAGISIDFVETLGGKLPVINTENHKDFLNVEAVLNGKNTLSNFPPTVNAFTISAKNEKIRGQKFILLNRAPYSNISAEKLNLSDEDWLEMSHTLRLRHECAHYETLRIFGSMRNHALDEILADAIGQIAAFGNFSAARQKLFFGLHGSQCDGRLTFYCKKIADNERGKVYMAVDKVLDLLEDKINRQQNYLERFCFIACNSIADILNFKSDS